MRGRVGGDETFFVKHDEPAIEQFPHIDAASVIGASSGSWRDLYPAARDGNGIVSSHRSFVAAAQDVLQIAGRVTPGGTDLPRWMGKSLVEVLEEGGKKGVAVCHALDAVKPQLAHEAIL